MAGEFVNIQEAYSKATIKLEQISETCLNSLRKKKTQTTKKNKR